MRSDDQPTADSEPRTDVPATREASGRAAFLAAPRTDTPLSLQQQLLGDRAPGEPSTPEPPADARPGGDGVDSGPVTIAQVRAKLLSEARVVASGIARNHALHDWPWPDAEQVLAGRFPVTYVAAPDPAAPPVPTIVGGHLLRFHADPGAMAQLDEVALLLNLARWAGVGEVEVAGMLAGFREQLTERRLDRAEGRR